MNSKAVIFDMDGLMLDTETLSIKAWREAAAGLGFPVSESLMHQMIGRTIEDIRAIIQADEVMGTHADRLIEHTDRLYHRMMDEQPPDLKPGLLELLAHLEEHGIPKAVATSSRRFQAERKLAAATLGHRFRATVCGDEIARGKPAPDIFLAAARALDCPPAQCLVLEDSEPGVLAAHRAGMPVIMVPDQVSPSVKVQEMALAVCQSLHEVIPLFHQRTDTETGT